MTYELAFKESALQEWHKLDGTIRTQFKKKLAERLEAPHMPSVRLRGVTINTSSQAFQSSVHWNAP